MQTFGPVLVDLADDSEGDVGAESYHLHYFIVFVANHTHTVHLDASKRGGGGRGGGGGGGGGRGGRGEEEEGMRRKGRRGGNVAWCVRRYR